MILDIRSLALVALSIACLPLSVWIVSLSYAAQILALQNIRGFRWRVRRSEGFKPKTILVTGVGMAKGLRIARAFYETGHVVIGADFEPNKVPVPGRFSRSLKKFYRLEKPSEKSGATKYIRGIVEIVEKEGVDLWISCSGVASAVEDGQAKEVLERKTACRCIQFTASTTDTLHEKDTFIRYTESLGLPTPETHEVRSRDAVHRLLSDAPRKKKSYIMKTTGVDDANRNNMTLLPRRTLSQTYNHISSLKIGEKAPWILQQYISGQEYCTHAIVVNGVVKLFVACPSAELLMHYKALPQRSGLSRAMLNFTKEFSARAGPGFTGHLSFDFLVEERATERGLQQNILPIECNPRAHTAVVLFSGKRGAIDMTNAYLSVFEPALNGSGQHDSDEEVSGSPKPSEIPYAQPQARGYYWIGHDLVSVVLHPLLRFCMFQLTMEVLVKGLKDFGVHLLLWKEGTYEIWDPLPWFVLYHIYWPGQFLHAMWTGSRWSRVNVSTTKIFQC